MAAGATALVRDPGDRLINRGRGHCLTASNVANGANTTTHVNPFIH
jgi:hypothetical protein